MIMILLELSKIFSVSWLVKGTLCFWPRSNGEGLSDFDVLSLCDTGAQWYEDATGREQLNLESKLQEPLGQMCM